MLSAKEIFKFRNKLDQTLTARSGEKEFMPDGSWLQDKHIESFHQERERIISEPRVLRSQDFAKGEWKPDEGLVELTYEIRSFWEHMGFNDDKNRKWLFPEEALFLLETGVFELWNEGLPMSIQEAYAAVMGENLSLEYYQVYSHLRRAGYVVVRHQGRFDFTKYERKIGLDKHVEPKKKKQRDNDKADQVETEKQSNNSFKEDQSRTVVERQTGNRPSDIAIDKPEFQTIGDDDLKPDEQLVDESKSIPCKQTQDFTNEDKNAGDNHDREKGEPAHELQPVHAQRPGESIYDESESVAADTVNVTEEMTSFTSTNSKISKIDFERSETCSEETFRQKVTSATELDHGRELTNTFESRHKEVNRNKSDYLKLSEWNFDEIIFPNFKTTEDTVYVSKPKVDYIPQGKDVCFCEEKYSFEKKMYINTKKKSRKLQVSDEELVQKLDFSYPEIMKGQLKVKQSCRNWKEYKSALEKKRASWDRSAALPHLYGNTVKPLVRPELARSTYAVLEQLKVITDDAPSEIRSKSEILPDFDAYAPHSKFRKTQPGIPDFRVKVFRMCDPVPGLDVVNSITSYLDDEVSLHWAIVNCGNISFYNIADMALPHDISLG